MRGGLAGSFAQALARDVGVVSRKAENATFRHGLPGAFIAWQDCLGVELMFRSLGPSTPPVSCLLTSNYAGIALSFESVNVSFTRIEAI